MKNGDTYRGRFAPSPSGPLHMGSLVAAVGSYLDARANQGEWFLRIEDLDPPREKAGAADDILRTLEAFGFEWDGPILYQSSRSEAYAAAASRLMEQGVAYRCACTRREVAEAGVLGPEGPRYPGTCRAGLSPGVKAAALRILTSEKPIVYSDRVFGRFSEAPGELSGDFLVRRADGLYAYQLAVVLDDAYQRVNRVVRGVDLLTSTARQIYLQQLLGLPTPNYMHLPLVTDPQGRKLSKQMGSAPVKKSSPMPALITALAFLGQKLPETTPADPPEYWRWAIENWEPMRIPQVGNLQTHDIDPDLYE